jgi:hypothetical protein
MKNISISIIVVFLAGFLTGCTTAVKYSASVSGFAASNANLKKRYIILPGNKDTSSTDIEFQEYSAMLKRVVDGAGFSQANSFDQAEVALFFSYSISDGEERTSSYVIPNFGQTGIASSTTYGTVRSSGYGTATYSGTTYNTPTYGITGYSSGVRSYTTYTRIIRVEAYDVKLYKETKEMKQLWKLSVASIGSSGDLRRVVPVMLAAASPYIGKSTANAISLEIAETDPRIQSIRGGAAPAIK